MKGLGDTIPEVIKVQRYHHFEDKSKGFIIGAIVLLLVSAISVGISISIWKDIRQLKNSVNFRVIRQGHPNVAYWADNTYHRDPETTKLLTERLEAEQLAAAEAEAAANEKVRNSEKSQMELFRLKKKLKPK